MTPLMLMRFVFAVIWTSPGATPELATVAAFEAFTHAAPDVPPALIAAIAYEESKFQDVRGKRAAVCGVMQVATGGSEAECRRLLGDRGYSYRSGLAKLREARAWCGGRGERCAHAVYGGGNNWRSDRAQKYAVRVIDRAAQIDLLWRPLPAI